MATERMIDWPPSKDQLLEAAVKAAFEAAVRWTGQIRVAWSLQELQANGRFTEDLRKILTEFDRFRGEQVGHLQRQVMEMVDRLPTSSQLSRCVKCGNLFWADRVCERGGYCTTQPQEKPE